MPLQSTKAATTRRRRRRAFSWLLFPGVLFLGLPLRSANLPYFAVLGDRPGAWPAILGSIGFQHRPAAVSHVIVAPVGTEASSDWKARIEEGAILILEGESPLAEMFGFKASKSRIRVDSLMDVHRPTLSIIWERGLDLPVFDLPSGAQVFSTDRRTHAAVMAGLRRGEGAVLWVAVSPGERGYERLPYLLAALSDLGLEPPFRSSRLWAFFDSAYRSRVDLDYFAARWRRAGISALQVAAWHFYESNPEQDQYLNHLIAACHREGILVYAWFDLPHVSEKFWDDHPEWREKTAALQDAQLDWRKLMNLTNRDCFRAVASGVRELAGRFDWDGVNLAELYFESLEGISNPFRFTPMNDDVRALFRRQAGFDALELFGQRRDDQSRRLFLDFRASLAHRMQEEWVGELESMRRRKPYLDLVLTHVDDRFDAGMHDAIGADAARVLPLLDDHAFTFLIEDPATVWNLGPQRYQTIAERYRTLTTHADKLAIDLNIVDRYQDVYPTKQQTGVELFQLVHQAAASFARVALYFENSLEPCDLTLLSAAAGAVNRFEKVGPKIVVNSPRGIGVPWRGAAMVDGLPWTVSDGETVWLPAGEHSIEPSEAAPGLHLVRLNGDLQSARSLDAQTIQFTYESPTRAIGIFDRVPSFLQVDGSEIPIQFAGPQTIVLPHGHHSVIVTAH
jgi:hypothetical protein